MAVPPPLPPWRPNRRQTFKRRRAWSLFVPASTIVPPRQPPRPRPRPRPRKRNATLWFQFGTTANVLAFLPPPSPRPARRVQIRRRSPRASLWVPTVSVVVVTSTPIPQPPYRPNRKAPLPRRPRGSLQTPAFFPSTIPLPPQRPDRRVQFRRRAHGSLWVAPTPVVVASSYPPQCTRRTQPRRVSSRHDRHSLWFPGDSIKTGGITVSFGNGVVITRFAYGSDLTVTLSPDG